MKTGLMITLIQISWVLVGGQAYSANGDPKMGDRQIFVNEDCATTDSCNLKIFWIEVKHLNIIMDGEDTWGTELLTGYETLKPQFLEEFALVQFVQGCMFNSYMRDGELIKYLGYSRKFFGEYITYQHPTLVLDSDDADAMLESYTAGDYPRHSNYKWNKIPGSTDRNTEKFYGEGLPAYPQLYTRSYPGFAYLIDRGSFKEAAEVSTQFRTCIYKTAEIPTSTEPGNIDFAQPLHCFDWYSSFRYDHTLEKYYSTPDQIEGFCRGT